MADSEHQSEIPNPEGIVSVRGDLIHFDFFEGMVDLGGGMAMQIGVVPSNLIDYLDLQKSKRFAGVREKIKPASVQVFFDTEGGWRKHESKLSDGLSSLVGLAPSTENYGELDPGLSGNKFGLLVNARKVYQYCTDQVMAGKWTKDQVPLYTEIVMNSTFFHEMEHAAQRIDPSWAEIFRKRDWQLLSPILQFLASSETGIVIGHQVASRALEQPLEQCKLTRRDFLTLSLLGGAMLGLEVSAYRLSQLGKIKQKAATREEDDAVAAEDYYRKQLLSHLPLQVKIGPLADMV